MKLIIKNADVDAIINKDDWELGWRLNLKDGAAHDMVWGSVPPDEESLQEVIDACKNRHNFEGIIDERAQTYRRQTND
jgi:hypothetical protein